MCLSVQRKKECSSTLLVAVVEVVLVADVVTCAIRDKKRAKELNQTKNRRVVRRSMIIAMIVPENIHAVATANQVHQRRNDCRLLE